MYLKPTLAELFERIGKPPKMIGLDLAAVSNVNPPLNPTPAKTITRDARHMLFAKTFVELNCDPYATYRKLVPKKRRPSESRYPKYARTWLANPRTIRAINAILLTAMERAAETASIRLINLIEMNEAILCGDAWDFVNELVDTDGKKSVVHARPMDLTLNQRLATKHITIAYGAIARVEMYDRQTAMDTQVRLLDFAKRSGETDIGLKNRLVSSLRAARRRTDLIRASGGKVVELLPEAKNV